MACEVTETSETPTRHSQRTESLTPGHLSTNTGNALQVALLVNSSLVETDITILLEKGLGFSCLSNQEDSLEALYLVVRTNQHAGPLYISVENAEELSVNELNKAAQTLEADANAIFQLVEGNALKIESLFCLALSGDQRASSPTVGLVEAATTDIPATSGPGEGRPRIFN